PHRRSRPRATLPCVVRRHGVSRERSQPNQKLPLGRARYRRGSALMLKTYKALTVKQPWAHLIVQGIKTIENRTWTTDYRGRLLIHAGRSFDGGASIQGEDWTDRLTFGAIIGHVELVDIVTEHSSPFFVGPFGWVLGNPKPIKPIPLRGKVGLFDVQLEF